MDLSNSSALLSGCRMWFPCIDLEDHYYFEEAREMVDANGERLHDEARVRALHVPVSIRYWHVCCLVVMNEA